MPPGMSHSFLTLVGPTRTGTTSLFRHLSGDVATFVASLRKETNFYITGDRHDLDSFLAQFPAVPAADQRVLLEASPLYFTAPGVVTARQRQTGPEEAFKILVTLREPVARFLSLYNHVATKRQVMNPPTFDDFVAAVFSSDARLDADPVAERDGIAYLEGCYAQVIAGWLTHAPGSDIKVMFLETLADPAARIRALTDLYAWLGKPPEYVHQAPYPQENRSRNVRFGALHKRALRANRRLEPLLNNVPVVRRLVRALYYGVNGREPSSGLEPSGPALRRLADAYREQNRDLPALIAGRTLGPTPAWVGADASGEPAATGSAQRVTQDLHTPGLI